MSIQYNLALSLMESAPSPVEGACGPISLVQLASEIGAVDQP